MESIMSQDGFNIHTLRDSMSEEQIRELIGSLSEAEAKALMYDWSFWARPNQLPPPGDWFGWLILAGRGFGKTRAGSEWFIQRAKAGFGPMALIGETTADVRDTMIEVGESSIMRVCPPDFMPIYEPSKRRLTFPNGVTATTFTGQEPDQLRGPQHSTVWADEPAKWDYVEECIEQMMYGLRIGKNPQFLATTTPRPIPAIKAWVEDPSVVVTTGSTFENAANLAPSFIKQMRDKYRGTRMGQQELYGKILWESDNAQWRQSEIDAFRIPWKTEPLMEVSAIGLDPSVGDPTVKKNIDMCGIVYGGRGVDHNGYVLADYSMKGTPAKWAERVKNIVEVEDVDWIIAEVNNGGKLVEETLVAYGVPRAKIILVNASKGKLVRAEPISLLAEQGRIRHVGTNLVKLEEELVTYEGMGKSPNRLDAMVWLMTFLMLQPKRKTKVKKLRV
jgi:phage terminase large subunit-like protein